MTIPVASVLELFELEPMRRAFWIAVVASPFCALLGAFVTLRRLAFFSHAISHSALTGLALGFTFHVASAASAPAMQAALAVFCVAIAVLMVWLFEFTTLPADTVMAFSFTGSVALGVVLISRLNDYRILEGALFGDILAARWSDVALIGALGIVTVGFLVSNMRALSLTIVNETLARLHGCNVRRLNYLFVILIALVVAVLMRQLGALLVNGLLVIPAAAARAVARDFRQMLWLSMVFGLAGAVAGIAGSFQFDAPTGPSILLADTAVLGAALALALALRGRHRPPAPRPLPATGDGG